MDEEEGRILERLIAQTSIGTSLEVGFAYGISTLYIFDALKETGQLSRHIVIDPFQHSQWRGIGLRNVRMAGYEPYIDFFESYSELVLPKLLADGVSLDFALIDGWHTFDQVLVEFYFINRMLNLGGVIVFDDADRESVSKVIRYALQYPAYRIMATAEGPRGSLAGKLRRTVGRVRGIDAILKPELVRRNWDLGIVGSCAAIQKIAEDQRTSGWFREF
jgi:predicted O-methyltransferase YrrM